MDDPFADLGGDGAFRERLDECARRQQSPFWMPPSQQGFGAECCLATLTLATPKTVWKRSRNRRLDVNNRTIFPLSSTSSSKIEFSLLRLIEI
jgi:hypothetical protein